MTQLEVGEIAPDRVGWKAFGISALPEAWTLPFLVIDDTFLASVPASRAEGALAAGLAMVGIAPEAGVIVRSSGSGETLRQRGGLRSSQCVAKDTISTLRELQTQTVVSSGQVHWVAQEYGSPRASGHLSNERRVSYEKRDWVLEVEPREGRPGYSSRFAVRRWRDGLIYSKGPLNCSSEARISLCLKQVAMWAHQFGHRIHFEWIWNGNRVLIVQADMDDSSAEGTRPAEVLPKRIKVVGVNDLQAFRLASSNDYQSYKKLRNAKVYGDLGYTMPPFYVLSDARSIGSILTGSLPVSVENDLKALTVRPLIIRTDGLNIPAGKHEMLPRSDELRSRSEAVTWLTGPFRETIKKEQLEGSSLILIAHHFVPSIASAWARSEPGRSIVRIEALWGIPEGLYWFAHDTFEVDAESVDVSLKGKRPRSTLPSTRKIRYKGSFIAPNADGRWVLWKTAAPFDWNPSVRRAAWLSEIAWRTRQIAEAEDQPVSVMWFVGNHADATMHQVLPWYHAPSHINTPKAAPPRKYHSSTDARIATRRDWVDLKTRMDQGKRVERVIVEPTDPLLIRDSSFANDLAALAKSRGLVVELSGGVLSHAYYILQRQGVKLECVDLFGSDEDVVEFNKVVRDRIPEGIGRKGERADVIRLAGDALMLALKQKLVEEALEVLDAASGEELITELADVLEVIHGLTKALEVGVDRVEKERRDKKKRRGGFERGIMLTKTATPRSLPAPHKKGDKPVHELDVGSSEASIITDPARLPMRPVYRRPDLRQPDEMELEKMLTVESDVNRLGDLKETFTFSLPDSDRGPQGFSLTIELKRTRAALRTVVRLRRLASQLKLILDEHQLHLFPRK
jgi:predicted house-cleaning noncanonical NTP pyrophosphatase (MazG superfamily)